MREAKPYVWIVQMWNEKRKRWEPTVGVGLTRAEAYEVLRNWKRDNPGDRFGLAPYIRIDKAEQGR